MRGVIRPTKISWSVRTTLRVNCLTGMFVDLHCCSYIKNRPCGRVSQEPRRCFDETLSRSRLFSQEPLLYFGKTKRVYELDVRIAGKCFEGVVAATAGVLPKFRNEVLMTSFIRYGLLPNSRNAFIMTFFFLLLFTLASSNSQESRRRVTLRANYWSATR